MLIRDIKVEKINDKVGVIYEVDIIGKAEPGLINMDAFNTLKTENTDKKFSDIVRSIELSSYMQNDYTVLLGFGNVVKKSYDIGGDKQELADFISAKLNLEYISSGRSGFAARNRFSFDYPRVSKVVEAHDRLTGDTIPLESEVIDLEGALALREKIESAKVNFNGLKDHEDAQKIRSLIGSNGYLEIGGREDFLEVPDDFYSLYSVRSINTKDSRCNRTHTYRHYLIDKSATGTLKLEIKDSEKGLAIGKKGANIKKAQKACKARLKIV